METGDQEFVEGSRLRYLLYRCHKCGRMITALQMERAFAKAEKFNVGKKAKDQKHGKVCVCGSRHVAPTNATTWEELSNPHVWVLWYKRVFLPWLKRNE